MRERAGVEPERSGGLTPARSRIAVLATLAAFHANPVVHSRATTPRTRPREPAPRVAPTCCSGRARAGLLAPPGPSNRLHRRFGRAAGVLAPRDFFGQSSFEVATGQRGRWPDAAWADRRR